MQVRIHSTNAFRLRDRLVDGRPIAGERIRVGEQIVDAAVLDRMMDDTATRPFLRAVKRGGVAGWEEHVVNPLGWVTIFEPEVTFTFPSGDGYLDADADDDEPSIEGVAATGVEMPPGSLGTEVDATGLMSIRDGAATLTPIQPGQLAADDPSIQSASPPADSPHVDAPAEPVEVLLDIEGLPSVTASELPHELDVDLVGSEEDDEDHDELEEDDVDLDTAVLPADADTTPDTPKAKSKRRGPRRTTRK